MLLILCLLKNLIGVGALVQWLWEEAHVSSNPGTICWMNIFPHLCVVKIVMCV